MKEMYLPCKEKVTVAIPGGVLKRRIFSLQHNILMDYFELPIIPIEVLPLPEEEFEFIDLPTPNVDVFEDRAALSPVTPKIVPIPSLLSLCTSQISKSKEIHGSCKYLPQHLKQKLLGQVEQLHKVSPNDKVLEILLGPTAISLDFSKYSHIKPTTIISTLCESQRSLRSLDLTQVTIKPADIAFDLSAVSFPSLRKLVLDRSNIPSELILPIAKSAPLLSLSVQHCKYIDMKTLFHVLSETSSLKELNISSNNFIPIPEFTQLLQSQTLLALSCEKSSTWLSLDVLHEIGVYCGLDLIDLRIDDLFVLHDEALCDLLSHCSSLQSLSIANCWNITDTSIQHLVEFCPTIKELNFDCCSQITDESLGLLSKHYGSSLKSLSVQQCELISPSSLEVLATSCPLLQRFDVPGNVTSIEAIAQNCHELRTLRVCGNHAFLRAPLIEDLALGCPKVHTIAIENNFYLNSRSVIAMVKNWPMLKSITLKNCAQLDDEALIAISQYSNALEELQVQKSFFSEKALSRCIENLGRLRRFNISGNNRFSDRNLIQIAERCDNLVDIDVRQCKNISSNGIQLFAHNCPGIESFSCSTPLCDDALVSLLRCRHLHSLKVGDASKLSLAALEKIADSSSIRDLHIVGSTISDNITELILHCAQLEQLYLCDCPNLSNAILPSLDSSNCDSIYLSGCSVSPTQIAKYSSLSNRVQVVGISGL